MEMEMEMEMEQFLPIEFIITEILSRLPVDSVIQCKCVCKTWRALIDDPAFADVHTHRLISTSTSSSSDSLFLVSCWLPSNSYQKQYHLVEYNDDNRITLKPSIYKSLPFLLESLDDYCHVSYSCNGLIFMHSNFTNMNHMIVCNPCTREYVNLFPILSNNITSSGNNPRHHFTFLAAQGFGYHPRTKEYKIVIISYYKYYSGQVVEYISGQVIVYTLGSGRWRSKGKLPNLLSDDTSVMILDGPGVLVNGVLHWIVENPGKEKIVLFDLEDEEFRVVPSPSHPGTQLNSIGLYAGCLCATRYNFKGKSSDIWVTKNKEYSWTRELSIPWNHEEKFNWKFLAYLKGGKILLIGAFYQPLVVFYDPETDSFEKNESFPDDFNWFSWIPYKKSFVSLKALGEKDTIDLRNRRASQMSGFF